MKVRSSVKKMRECCRSIIRKRRVFVLFTANPIHKQRRGFFTFAYQEQLPPLPTQLIVKNENIQNGGSLLSRFVSSNINNGVSSSAPVFRWRIGISSILNRFIKH